MPLLSVILPVFNGEKYLDEAIVSMLHQTFQDFELLIINDGSYDNSEQIINSFSDQRIRYLKNDSNKGLVYSLNKGLEHAKGKFIARMDADDISYPERLENQYHFLLSNPDIAVIDGQQAFIDENGNPTGLYNSEITGCDTIKQKMPWQNCMGHPSVMMRAEVIKAYLYRQAVYEDYDLWLRMLNDGLKLERTTEPLLWYRVHQQSIIAKSQSANQHFKKIADTKLFYLSKLPWYHWFKPFNLKVIIAMMLDYLTWGFKKLKSSLQE